MWFRKVIKYLAFSVGIFVLGFLIFGAVAFLEINKMLGALVSYIRKKISK